MRCETCNIETIWPHKFCSKECEDGFWVAMGEPDDDCLFPEDEPEMTLEDLEEMNELNNESDRLKLYDDLD